MITIPKQLQEPRFSFLLLAKKDVNNPEKPYGKIPTSKFGWKSFSFNDKELLNHLANDGNYGIFAENNLIIIDIDDKTALLNLDNKFPKTFTIETKRGRHYYYYSNFNTNVILERNSTHIGEIRANHQYVVGPHSIHPDTGNSYNVCNDVGIATIDAKDLKSLLHDYIPNTKKKDKHEVENFNFIKSPLVVDIKNKIKISSLLQEYNIDVKTKNPTNCPFHTSESGRCLHFDDDKQVWNCFHCETGGDVITLYMIKNDCNFYKAVEDLAKKAKISEEEIIKFKLVFNDTVDIQKTADYFNSKYHFKTIATQKFDKLYIWTGRVWENQGEALIKEDFERILEKYAKNNPLLEVISKIKRKNFIESIEFERTNINLVPLENGVFNIETKELLPHSPNNFFKTYIPVLYDSTACCPIFLKFINEILYPEDIPVIQEWFGFQLYRRYLYKKAMILVGEPNTGKTVLLNVLTNFIGEKNKTGLSLQAIGSHNNFTKMSLKNMHSNIYDDLAPDDVNSGGNFKMATGAGNITAEEKFGDLCQFQTYAKMTFACNAIPPVKYTDDPGYYLRWIVIRMDNAIPIEEQDEFLVDKILSEKSGIFNWAIEGLLRLLTNHKFSYLKNVEEIKSIMEMFGDTLVKFGNDVLDKSVGHKITKEDMNIVYRVWCSEDKGRPVFSKENLGRLLDKKITYLIATSDGKTRYWSNVALKDVWKDKLDIMNNNVKKSLKKQQKTLEVN